MMKRGCRDCEHWMEHCYWDHFPTCKSFMKTLTGHFAKRLSLPKKFTTHLKEFALQTVRLEGPAGEQWNVGLTERKGYLCFQEGWKELVNAHNLVENDTLLFKYEGESRFSFTVYDANGCEKASAYFVNNKFDVEEECDEMNHEDSTPLKCEIVSREGEGHNILVPKPEPVEASEAEEQRVLEDTTSRRTKKCAKLSREKALVLASDFESSRPSFKSVMKSYNVPPSGYRLALTAAFARKHLPKTKCDVRLRIPGGEMEWKVNYRIYRESIYMFVGSWKNFAKDNSLKEGDVLMFEQTEDATLLDVHIYRA